jgi:hypothetical protein
MPMGLSTLENKHTSVVAQRMRLTDLTDAGSTRSGCSGSRSGALSARTVRLDYFGEEYMRGCMVREGGVDVLDTAEYD